MIKILRRKSLLKKRRRTTQMQHNGKKQEDLRRLKRTRPTILRREKETLAMRVEVRRRRIPKRREELKITTIALRQRKTRKGLKKVLKKLASTGGTLFSSLGRRRLPRARRNQP